MLIQPFIIIDNLHSFQHTIFPKACRLLVIKSFSNEFNRGVAVLGYEFLNMSTRSSVRIPKIAGITILCISDAVIPTIQFGPSNKISVWFHDAFVCLFLPAACHYMHFFYLAKSTELCRFVCLNSCQFNQSIDFRTINRFAAHITRASHHHTITIQIF